MVHVAIKHMQKIYHTLTQFNYFFSDFILIGIYHDEQEKKVREITNHIFIVSTCTSCGIMHVEIVL